MAKRKKNYLNNKDMLREIHLSKISYCSFLNKEEDNQQDFIVQTYDELWGTQLIEVGKDADGKPILEEVPVVDLAIKARAVRLTKLDIPTEIEDVKLSDVVFRVMTKDHIPLVPKKKSKAALAKAEKEAKAAALFDELIEGDDEISSTDDVEMIHLRCGFPSFFHYRITDLDAQETRLVGKSHWKGDLETGAFDKDHGRTTDKLATYYIKLCERYGTRSNWRSYTYNDEMQGQALVQLTQIGLQFNEMKSQNPFAYYTAAVTNSFTRVLLIEKKMQNIRDDILEANGLSPSWTRQAQNEEVPNQFTYDHNLQKKAAQSKKEK